MTMPQLLTLLFVVTVYVVIVVLQLTAGEKWLREMAWRGAEFRIGLSFVHFFIGFLAFSVMAAYVNIGISGDYRHGVGFLFQICGGVIGLAVPWLGLLWQKHGRGE